MIRIPRADQSVIERNRKRNDHHGRCIICDAPINPDTAKGVYVHCGGSHIVTWAEYEGLDQTAPGAGLGTQHIGPECYRKRREELRPYVNGGAA